MVVLRGLNLPGRWSETWPAQLLRRNGQTQTLGPMQGIVNGVKILIKFHSPKFIYILDNVYALG